MSIPAKVLRAIVSRVAVVVASLVLRRGAATMKRGADDLVNSPVDHCCRNGDGEVPIACGGLAASQDAIVTAT